MIQSSRCSNQSSRFLVVLLFLFTLFSQVYSQQASNVGCYKADDSFVSIGPYIYQSSGICTTNCTSRGYTVAALTNGDECLCGSSLPSTSVDSSFCSMPCAGYGKEDCGAKGYFTVWSTGVSDSQLGSSPVSSSPTATSSTSSQPTIVYVTTGGVTVTQTRTSPTETSTSANSNTANTSSSGIGAGAIAGIVVGIILLAAIAVGAFIFVRRRRMKKEDPYSPQTSSSPFAASNGLIQRSDPRLEPQMMQRRVSEGSLADEQDYSRKILRVVNS